MAEGDRRRAVIGPRVWWALAIVSACDPPVGPSVHAIWDPARGESPWDLPFPSDADVTEDGPDLSFYPRVTETVVGRVSAGWVDRIPTATRGFAANGPVIFRFDGVPPAFEGVETFTTAGGPEDAVVLLDVEAGTFVPLEGRFIQDPGNDPFLATHTLVVAPALGATPASGATILAAVTKTSGAAPAAGWTSAEADIERWSAAGGEGDLVLSTRYTVQDSLGEIRALRAAFERFYAPPFDWGEGAFRRVLRLDYAPGLTPSGREAQIATLSFEDGSTATHHHAPNDTPAFSIDLGASWPMVVYQAEIPVPYFQGLADRPFMRPGAMHVTDDDEWDGWLRFDNDGLLNAPEADRMRVVLSIPKGPDGGPIDNAPLWIWDHGTGGSAWNHVQRRAPADRGGAFNTVVADEGWAILGRDQPFFGTRYDVVDAGFSDGSLGFYNILNLPAFRDNQRQGAIEGHAALLFARGALNGWLPEGSIDPTRVRRGGHSLGSVTAHGGVAADPGAYEGALVSGAAGWFVLSFLETGLAGTGSGIFETLSDLFGVEVSPGEDLGAVLAAGLGIDGELGAERLDRLHPAIAPFQWIVDPSDPSTLVDGMTTPVSMIMGVGDWQVPNAGSQALWTRYPNPGVFTACAPTADYDPHYCTWREDAALDAVHAFLAD